MGRNPRRLILVAALLRCGPAAFGDDGLFTSLYADRRACDLGDTLQLIITENATASMSADRCCRASRMPARLMTPLCYK